MTRLSRRLVVMAVTTAVVAALGLVPPPGESGVVGPESAAAAALPQPGKRGKAVRALQKRLVDASYLRAQCRTGYYGTRTKRAVRALQKAYHLKAGSDDQGHGPGPDQGRGRDDEAPDLVPRRGHRDDRRVVGRSRRGG